MADSLLKDLLEMETIDLEMKKKIAQAYYDNVMKKKAIKILADCLKDNPEDKEIIDR